MPSYVNIATTAASVQRNLGSAVSRCSYRRRRRAADGRVLRRRGGRALVATAAARGPGRPPGRKHAPNRVPPATGLANGVKNHDNCCESSAKHDKAERIGWVVPVEVGGDVERVSLRRASSARAAEDGVCARGIFGQ